MPKKPIEWNKCIIYKIYKDGVDDFYIGSTTHFTKRKYNHSFNCNNKMANEYNFSIYKVIRENGGWNTWNMIPLEEYKDCENFTQARIREEKWRCELKPSLNTYKAFVAETTQEYQNIYREQNRAKLLQNKREYGCQKYICDCGSIIRRDSLQKHLKSLKHINLT